MHCKVTPQVRKKKIREKTEITHRIDERMSKNEKHQINE